MAFGSVFGVHFFWITLESNTAAAQLPVAKDIPIFSSEDVACNSSSHVLVLPLQQIIVYRLKTLESTNFYACLYVGLKDIPASLHCRARAFVDFHGLFFMFTTISRVFPILQHPNNEPPISVKQLNCAACITSPSSSPFAHLCNF